MAKVTNQEGFKTNKTSNTPVFRNGCTAVNGGTLMEFENGFQVELMGKAYSSHGANLTATYLRSNEGKASKVLIYVTDAKDVVLFFYKNLTDNHHYTSKRYERGVGLPSKYQEAYFNLCHAHKLVFGI